MYWAGLLDKVCLIRHPTGRASHGMPREESVVSSETLFRLCGGRLEGSRCVALSVEVLKVGGSE